MKFPSAAALTLFLVGTANSATVTIDFNEVTPQANWGQTAVTSQGYDFATGGTICGGPGDQESGVSANGIYIINPAPEPAICAVNISMQRSDAGAFAIHSFDVFGAGGYFGSSQPYYGTLAGGGIANLSVAIGTGDWLNLNYFSVRSENFFYNNLRLDNILVSTVPVPPAVWLFVSGLGLLGWMRR